MYVGCTLGPLDQLDHLKFPKFTFLFWQVLAGLASPTEGSIMLGRGTTQRSLSTKVGIVFQFPER